MKVQELIKQLQDLPPDLDVWVWQDGSRYEVGSVDDSFINDKYPFVDINTATWSEIRKVKDKK